MDKSNTERFKEILIELGQFPLVFYKGAELFQLRARKGCVEIWKAIVITSHVMDIFVGVGHLGRRGYVLHFLCQDLVAGNNRTAASAGNGFVAVKAVYPKEPKCSRVLSLVRAPQ